MLCSRLAESVFAKDQPCTATRMFYFIVIGATLILCRCPCLTCSVKIAQVGISEVVYSQEYSVDAMVRFHILALYNLLTSSGCIHS
jgi:deoxycytidylate deaminase